MWSQAVRATLHCLTGCAIGEVLGLAIASALGWSNAPSIALAVVLAFFFGYLLTYRATRSIRTAFATDTVSISTMELVDNAFVLLVPGAMEATLGDLLFWWSLAVGLAIAFVVTVPVNRWLLSRGRGHAHAHHH
jgi:putative flippase GtrA